MYLRSSHSTGKYNIALSGKFEFEIAMSYEKCRTKAYSDDIRWRVVYQRKALDYSLEKVATCLGISVATVYRIEQMFDETGSIEKRKYPMDHGPSKLTYNDKLLILELVLERPGIYLNEIGHELERSNGTVISVNNL